LKVPDRIGREALPSDPSPCGRTRHFYKPPPLCTLEEISADILAIGKEAEGLLDGLLKGGGA